MDYNDPSGEKATVAIVKYPSKIPPGQKGYLGPILFNPGLLFPPGLSRMFLLILRKVVREVPVFRWCSAARRALLKCSGMTST